MKNYHTKFSAILLCFTRIRMFLQKIPQIYVTEVGDSISRRPISGSTHKTGRREVPGSIPSLDYRPSRSEFSVVFSETSLNMG